MGAQLWYHDAPWHSDPADALRALQASYLAENYDLSLLLPQELRNACETLAATRADGDQHGLVDLYEQQVRLLERFNSEPIPADAQAQIEILRQVNGIYGQGVSNVLDIKEVSPRRDLFTAQRLTDSEVIRLVGEGRPTMAQASKAVTKINEELGRGECVCFPVYNSADRDKGVAWYFVGNTVD